MMLPNTLTRVEILPSHPITISVMDWLRDASAIPDATLRLRLISGFDWLPAAWICSFACSSTFSAGSYNCALDRYELITEIGKIGSSESTLMLDAISTSRTVVAELAIGTRIRCCILRFYERQLVQ